MSKVAVVYWSGTGNTESMADMVADGVRDKGAEAEVITASDFSADRLGDFDAFAFGCSDQGDEELEADEFLPMYDDVEGKIGSDKPVLLFGSYGEWNDGEWMDDWQERAEDAGLKVVGAIKTVEAPDDDAEAELKAAAAKLV